MKKKLRFLLLFLSTTACLSAQVLDTTHLPIIVIETDNGQYPPNEPKTDGHMGIIWNGDGAVNDIDDPFNHFDGKIAIEVRGSSSQFVFPKNGFAVETRNDDETDKPVSLLGFPEEADWVLYGPYTDKSLMRDAFTYIMASWTMEYAPRVKFCELVLNGQYWGVYVFTEKIERDANRVNISKLTPDENTGDEVTGGYILKFDKWDGGFNDGFNSNYPPYPGSFSTTTFQYHYPKADEITPSQKAYIQTHIAVLEGNLMSPDFKDSLEGYRKYFDMDAFFNFFFMQEISRNVDGYRLSTFMHKDKDSENFKLKMGPVWDFNLGYGNVDYCIGPGTSGWAIDFADFCPNDWVPHFWWERMWKDDAFRQEMHDRWFALRQTTLTNERLLGVIDSLENLLKSPASRNYQRWPILGQYVWPNSFIGNTYQSEVAFFRNWLVQRLAWLDGAMNTVNVPIYNPAEYFPPKVQPNPFGDKVTFKYHVSNHDQVKIEIFSAQGQRIAMLSDEQHPPGENKMEWGDDAPAGVYFYRVWYDDRKEAFGKIIKN